MQLIPLLIAAVVVCLTAASLRRRIRFPAVIRVLGQGGWHFMLLGIIAGLTLPPDGAGAVFLSSVSDGLVGIALVWVGIQVGLDVDLRRFGRVPAWRIRAEVLQVVASLAVAGILVSLFLPYAGRHLGADTPSGLLLALGGYVASVSVPELLYIWRNRLVWLPPAAAGSLSAATNPAVLLAYTLAFPLVGSPRVLSFGSFEAVGYVWWVAAPAALGLLAGVCLDFVLRSHHDIGRSAFLSLAVVATVAGVGLASNLPGIAVGFAAGVWLINATVRRREVLQMSERVGAVVAPVLHTFLGFLVAAQVGLDLRTPVLLTALCMFVGRGAIRAASAWIAWRITARGWRFQDTVGLAWRPAGLLAIALLAESLTLSPDASVSRLIAPAICAVFLTRMVPLPAIRDPSALQQHASPVAAQGI